VDRPDLSIAVRRAPGEAVVTLAGEIDMSTVQRLATAVDAELAEATARVVLDMAGVTFCDSQGLGTLVVLSRKATMAQSYLLLVNVGDFLLRVLDITGLRGALMIQDAPVEI
jgi:anti-anti-sigma factor